MILLISGILPVVVVDLFGREVAHQLHNQVLVTVVPVVVDGHIPVLVTGLLPTE